MFLNGTTKFNGMAYEWNDNNEKTILYIFPSGWVKSVWHSLTTQLGVWVGRQHKIKVKTVL